MMKTVWVEAFSVRDEDHLVDGARLTRDTERALNDMESSGYELVSITPVVSGRYAYKAFDSRVTADVYAKPTIAPDTCASWGYSMTDGVMIVGKAVRR